MQVFYYLNTALPPTYILAVHHLLPQEPPLGVSTASSGQPPTPSPTLSPWATIFFFHYIVSSNCVCLSLCPSAYVYTHTRFVYVRYIYVLYICVIEHFQSLLKELLTVVGVRT